MLRKSIVFLLSFTFYGLSYAQADSKDGANTIPAKSGSYNQKTDTLVCNAGKKMNSFSTVNSSSFVLPAGLVLTGSLLFKSEFNKNVQQKITPDDLIRKIHIDNYLQYAPAGITIGLEAAGIKGKHSPLQTSMIYALSNVMLNAVVIPVKHISHELRPDGSDYFSFPSGHTTEAFASAELMRLEYKDNHPWLGVAGYMMAAATGYLRMYNNKHWVSDVITGAGIGIASTRLSYLIIDKLYSKHKRAASSKSKTAVLPIYHNHQTGFCLVQRF